LFFNARNCEGCGACVAVCPTGAVSLQRGRSRTDRDRCVASGHCVAACPNEARTITGRRVTAGEVFDEAAADAIFYGDSGGGITLSGGDPLAQPEFSAAVLSLARAEGIHTAVDTCGHADWPAARRVFELADLILYDIKHMDPAAHQQATGVLNGLILENARKIVRELKIPMRIRVPVVPRFNDSPEEIAAVARFVASELGRSIPVDLLPYHGLGSGKRQLLEMALEGPEAAPPPEHMERLRSLVTSFGLEAKIGG
jgi:pyruvate formate lyase activating enzyme